jgi:uncharacterized protein (TIGR00369 family)
MSESIDRNEPNEGEATPVDPETEGLYAVMPLARTLGIRIISEGPEGVVASAPWMASHTTAGGIMHGGHLMALADAIGALCAFLNLPDGALTSTIESKSNFMRPVSAGEVGIRSVPVHVGRTTIVVQTDITDSEARLVTRTTQTQAIIVPRSPT